MLIYANAGTQYVRIAKGVRTPGQHLETSLAKLLGA